MIRMIAAVRAVLTAAALLAGVPVLLVILGGSPLPDRWPSATELQTWLNDPLLPRYGPAMARVIAWLIWALIAALILAMMGAKARRWRWARLTAYLPGPVQGLAATVLGAATVTNSAVAAQPAHATAASTPPPAADIPTAAGGGRVTLVAAGDEHIHTVQRGETLSEIAEQCLGDDQRWPEIFALNRGTHFTNVGGTLTDPNLIYPGWRLELPDDAAQHHTDDHHTGTRRPDPGQPGPGQPQPGEAGHGPAPSSPSAAAASSGATAATTAPSSRPSTGLPGDDGVAPAASSASPSRRPADRSTPHGDRDTGRDARRDPRGVALPSGSWVDLGLALAIAAAAALVWAHRRRRYTRRPPAATLHTADPDLTPMPPVVTQMRRGLRKPSPEDNAFLIADGDQPGNPDPDFRAGRADEPGDDAAIRAAVRTDRHGRQLGYDRGREDASQPDDAAPAAGGAKDDAVPVVPALRHALIDVWPPAGLGLIGDGAHAAARGFLVSALAAGGLDDPDARTHVVMPATTAATLFGAAAVALPSTPRLTITGGLDDALDLLEAQILHRTRLAYAHQVDDVAALRATDPHEQPLPPVMLLADADSRHERTRIAAVLAQGQRLDIHGVLLGPWPDGDTVAVAADGTTNPADGDAARHGSHPADIGRLTVLDPTETAELLGTLAESHTGKPQQTPVIEHTIHPTAVATGRSSTAAPTVPEPGAPVSVDHSVDDRPATVPASAGLPSPAAGTSATGHDSGAASADPALDQPPVPATAAPPVSTADQATDDRPATVGDRESAAAAGDGQSATPVPVEEVACSGDAARRTRAEVTVLGAAGIIDADPQRPLRKKSLEVLVYLAVHDGAASAEAILDDVLADAPARKAAGRLYTYISDLRAILRRTAGADTYITHPDHRYVLNRDNFDIDLWRMRDAIRDAQTADTANERRAALRRAVDCYRGHLAEGADYEWIEPYREAVRRQALDAYLALTDALTGNPTGQLAVLEEAIRHNPHTEVLYQHAMQAHAAAGHLDAIRALRRTLTRALSDIDAEPSSDTVALADRLLTAAPSRSSSTAALRPASQLSDGASA